VERPGVIGVMRRTKFGDGWGEAMDFGTEAGRGIGRGGVWH
jgi:hypothetical protein